MVEVEIENEKHYHVDAMDHSDVEEEQEDQDDNWDYLAMVVQDFLEAIEASVVDNSVVVVVVVDARNHDPRRKPSIVKFKIAHLSIGISQNSQKIKTKTLISYTQ